MKKITKLLIALLVTSCMWQVNAQTSPDYQGTCPLDITVNNDPGVCGASVSWTAPTAIDPDDGLPVTVTQTNGLPPGSFFAVGGPFTIEYTAFDNGSDPPSICTFTVTVQDNEDPVITCPANITVSNDPGSCDAVVTYATPVGTDNCPGESTTQTAGLPSGSAFPVGTTTNTFVVTDAAGNTATCSFDVTVNDDEDPVIACPANITVSNDPGSCDAVVTYATPVGTDNCPGESTTQTAGLPSGATFPVGTTTNTFVVTDAAGNTATCSFDVTVNDDEDPVVTCPADITVSNDPGQCDAVVTFMATAVDNCPGVTTSSVPASGSVFPVGTTTVTVTATDAAGNTDVCTFDVIVNDDEDPVAICPADITVSNDPGSCDAVVTFAPTATDNCPGVTTSSVPASGSVFPVGTTTVTVTATDASGNTDVCTFDVTVDDDEDPIIACPGDFNVSNDPGVCGAVIGYGIGFIDNCPGAILMQTTGLPSGSTFPIGTTTNTFVVTDASGNTATCSFDVTVNDTEPPVITCPADITVNNDPGVCGAIVNYTVTTSDNCPGETVVLTAGQASGTTFPVGTTTNTFVVTDASGNTATCSFDVTVNDTEPPVITCPADITVNNDPGVCGAIVNYTVTTSDNCPGETVVLTAGQASGTTFPVGTTTNTFVVTDASGNTATCSFDVTVNDTEPPVINCPADITVNNDAGLCSAVVTYAITTSDNCPGETVAQTAGLPSGSAFPVGTTTNTFVVTDASGNTATCSFDVTVVDNEPPIAMCVAPFTIQLDANGMASITPADVDNGSTDNCGIASLDVSPSMFTCADVGPNTVTLTVTDVNGNVSTCTTTVTVEDNVPPVAVCMDIDVFLDANGEASITPADVDGGSTDACGIASLAIDIMDFTCADLGPNNVTLTVTDNNGNVSSCVAVVTVIDAIPPTISCPADIFTSTDPSICGAIVVFPDAIALDNCAVTVAQTDGPVSGSVFPVGVTTIEYTATDEGGNTTVCTFTITVEDLTPPVAVCQDITIQLDANGNAMITAADVDGGSFDNCGVITGISIDIDTFDCSDLGDNPVVLSVTDDNGNVGTCTAIVTVEDVTAPDPVCLDITVQLDAAGTVTIVATDVDGGSTDACGIDTYSIDIDTFTCDDVGDNPVVLTVTDASGNSSSCTAIVTVEDVTDPVVTCMDIVVGLDENGEASIVPADVIASVTDACGFDTAALDISDFTCDDIGFVTVTVFVTDVNGNTSSCTAVVEVKDGLDPILTCPTDLLVEIDEGTTYTVPDFIADGTVTVTDNCTDPVTITTQDPAPGTILPEGVYPVTMTAEDDYGNGATCTFNLTVLGVLGVGNTFDISTIMMYPNPATNMVNISNPQNIELEQVAIYDVTGRLIQTNDLRDMGTEQALDISQLSTATYLVVIQGQDGGQITKQLTKE